MTAQINRYFWGLELGSSTKSEVSNFLKRNNLTYEQNSGGDNAFYVNGELELGGYLWEPTIGFYGNTLFNIQLMIFHTVLTNNGEFMDNSGTTTNVFYDLKSKLSKLYPDAENVADSQNPGLYVLRDEKTVIILELDEERNLHLSYFDRRLGKLMQSGSGL